MQLFGAAHLTRRLHRDLAGVFGLGAGTPIGELTGEYPQVCHYRSGEYFSAHEDAFPVCEAQRSNYQRRATLLVYLNDVERGGCTTFEGLGLEVRPRRGTALLFFPAFADGRPDVRTRHAAEAAEAEKWIAQVWAGGAMGQRLVA
mmetsp:Transcript_143516/g.458953  ORF Transcript_143516/g.458953 Transcript_143516/m.458953 type:complete len:145 (+) Transcript_143516:617-1051(+)